MYSELEEIIDEFYKLYYKIEQLNLDSTIKCLTTNEIHIINAIAKDKITMNDLADRLGITMGTISVSVNKLEKKYFVYREKASDDKRKVYVELTKKGKLAYDFCNNFNTSVFEKATKNIDKKDLKLFCNVFKQMTINLYEIRRQLQPESLFKFKVSDQLIIDEVRGNRTMVKYLSQKGFVIGRIIEIAEKNKNSITVKINDKEKVISSEDAGLIYVIKKGE